MDTGIRKFGIAAAVTAGAIGAGRFDIALAAFCVYTAANVVLKLFGKAPEPTA